MVTTWADAPPAQSAAAMIVPARLSAVFMAGLPVNMGRATNRFRASWVPSLVANVGRAHDPAWHSCLLGRTGARAIGRGAAHAAFHRRARATTGEKSAKGRKRSWL